VIEVYNPLMQDYFKLPLAGPAQKQARAVADHIHGKVVNNTGYIGSSVIQVFNYAGAATGLNEHALEMMDLEYDSVTIIPKDKVGLMPDSEELHFKLLFEKPTGRILGAQAIGLGNVDKRIDVIATAIKFGATIEHLRDLELCYAPPFGTAKDVVNFAGYVASNILHGAFKQIQTADVRPLCEAGAYILDVREVCEYEESHIKNAVNIPLSELRQRFNEIPKDKPVYVHCRSGQRSYNAILALQEEGFENVINISGGFMGLSYYEYYNDKLTKRKKIVTNYNFE
jgi:rhodanese-related sulfurtransferase